MEKIVKRGYVKWTDEDGVFHKEPLADHPELLAKASPTEQLRAEEVRRLNAAADEAVEEKKSDADADTKETLEALKSAPEEVLTAGQLTTEETAPASAAEEPVVSEEAPVDADREAALAALREKTATE